MNNNVKYIDREEKPIGMTVDQTSRPDKVLFK